MKELLDPSDPAAPRYWMHETSGALRPVIEAYLNGEALSPAECATMRAYLRQWIMSPVWEGPGLQDLRIRVETLTTRASIEGWLDDATDLGMDPI